MCNTNRELLTIEWLEQQTFLPENFTFVTLFYLIIPLLLCTCMLK